MVWPLAPVAALMRRQRSKARRRHARSGGLRGPNQQAVGQLEPEQCLPDRCDAVRMNALLELCQRARPCAVDHPPRCSSRSQAVPAAGRQCRAVGLIDNGLRGGQADAEDGETHAAAPYRSATSIDWTLLMPHGVRARLRGVSPSSDGCGLVSHVDACAGEPKTSVACVSRSVIWSAFTAASCGSRARS